MATTDEAGSVLRHDPPIPAELKQAFDHQLHRSGGRYALCTMCIGVRQGIVVVVERL